MSPTTLPHSGTATSRAAARNKRVVTKSQHDRRVLAEFVANRGAFGATDQEIAAACPEIHKDAVRARRGECWAHGMITDSMGERRATESGNAATVYHITSRGIRALGLPSVSWCVTWPE